MSDKNNNNQMIKIYKAMYNNNQIVSKFGNQMNNNNFNDNIMNNMNNHNMNNNLNNNMDNNLNSICNYNMNNNNINRMNNNKINNMNNNNGNSMNYNNSINNKMNNFMNNNMNISNCMNQHINMEMNNCKNMNNMDENIYPYNYMNNMNQNNMQNINNNNMNQNNIQNINNNNIMNQNNMQNINYINNLNQNNFQNMNNMNQNNFQNMNFDNNMNNMYQNNIQNINNMNQNNMQNMNNMNQNNMQNINDNNNMNQNNIQNMNYNNNMNQNNIQNINGNNNMNQNNMQNINNNNNMNQNNIQNMNNMNQNNIQNINDNNNMNQNNIQNINGNNNMNQNNFQNINHNNNMNQNNIQNMNFDNNMNNMNQNNIQNMNGNNIMNQNIYGNFNIMNENNRNGNGIINNNMNNMQFNQIMSYNDYNNTNMINNNMNNNNNNIFEINNNTGQQFQNLCKEFNYNSNNISILNITYKLNIIYFDKDLKNNVENNNNCSFFKRNVKGTFYGCHNFELFQYVVEKIKDSGKEFVLISSGSSSRDIFNYCSNIEEIKYYFIYCFNLNEYINLNQIYPKLIGVYNNFDSLKMNLLSLPPVKNDFIKSSNLIFFEDYNRIYIKLHYEIIRKYLIYKLLKSRNNEMKFKQFIQNKNPYYLEIGNQLFNEDKDEIINYFKKNTEENEELIKKVINCSHDIKNYISNYTFESFYYKYLNKFLREGNFDCFRILSSHISIIIYHLYDLRKNNIQNHDFSILFRNMYISPEEFELYNNSINKIICYPSFTSTSLNDNTFIPNKNNTNEQFVKLLIEQNNSKSVVSIKEFSVNKNENEYLFLPFSFFKIINVEKKKGTQEEPHIINLRALNSEEPIEEMILHFMENETDSLDLEGLDMLVLSNCETKITINRKLLTNK